ncbi:uncharacterized protein CTRU02_201496 [Colletotrichum truncatum]|uniref:Uncharacterized protein n=1 Tax=Colletotrichum truncatum TaxID=5467 RepID=A0ACC3ZHL7_COLTU|nr:uncharacterized protein CTRU02_14367 [Colletotrichum truncatum]KAF6782328.1 hypothetical protein CTRU02_14367 [Colletotrichum truncatum]
MVLRYPEGAIATAEPVNRIRYYVCTSPSHPVDAHPFPEWFEQWSNTVQLDWGLTLDRLIAALCHGVAPQKLPQRRRDQSRPPVESRCKQPTAEQLNIRSSGLSVATLSIVVD